MKITKKDIIIISIVFLFISALTLTGWHLMSWTIVFVTIIFTLLIINILMFELYRRHKVDSFKIDSDLKSLVANFNTELKLLQTEFNHINTEFNNINTELNKISTDLESLLKEADMSANKLSIISDEQSGIKEGIRTLGINQKKLSDELKIDINTTFIQTESLFSLFSTVKPKLPLPATRGWATSPDILNLICTMVLTKKPRYVFEAGSGVSTIVIAYCLKHLGKGKIISLDHLSDYADATREMISLHDLTEFAEIYHAPIKNVQINNEAWLWYDLDCLNIQDTIDILIVDGPPAAIQPLARYPALPLLYNHLSEDVVIIMDDGIRQDEKDIAERYKNEFPSFTSQYKDLEKGAFILTRIK